MKKEAKRWHLLSPEDYNKVFDYLSKKYHATGQILL
jgi:hypothetical protein